MKIILAFYIILGVILFCENREWFPDMIGLGKNVSRSLLKPEGIGHEFVRDLFMYWEEIEHLYTLLKQNDTSALEMYKLQMCIRDRCNKRAVGRVNVLCLENEQKVIPPCNIEVHAFNYKQYIKQIINCLFDNQTDFFIL